MEAMGEVDVPKSFQLLVLREIQLCNCAWLSPPHDHLCPPWYAAVIPTLTAECCQAVALRWCAVPVWELAVVLQVVFRNEGEEGSPKSYDGRLDPTQK